MNINIIHILIHFNSKCAVTACHKRREKQEAFTQ